MNMAANKKGKGWYGEEKSKVRGVGMQGMNRGKMYEKEKRNDNRNKQRH